MAIESADYKKAGDTPENARSFGFSELIEMLKPPVNSLLAEAKDARNDFVGIGRNTLCRVYAHDALAPSPYDQA